MNMQHNETLGDKSAKNKEHAQQDPSDVKSFEHDLDKSMSRSSSPSLFVDPLEPREDSTYTEGQHFEEEIQKNCSPRPLDPGPFNAAQAMDLSDDEDSESICSPANPQSHNSVNGQQEGQDEGAEEDSYEVLSSNIHPDQDAPAAPSNEPVADQEDDSSLSRARSEELTRPPIKAPRPSPGRPKGSKSNARYHTASNKRRCSARVAEAMAGGVESTNAGPTPSKRGRPKKGMARKVTKPRNKHSSAPEQDTGSEREWEVESIVDSVIESGTFDHYYLVKWEGFPSKCNTWEPKANLRNCRAAIETFEKGAKSRTSRK